MSVPSHPIPSAQKTRPQLPRGSFTNYKSAYLLTSQSRKKLASLLFSFPQRDNNPPSTNQNKTKKHTKTSTEGILCPLIYLSVPPSLSLLCISVFWLISNAPNSYPASQKLPNSLCNKTSYIKLYSPTHKPTFRLPPQIWSNDPMRSTTPKNSQIRRDGRIERNTKQKCRKRK